MPSNISIYGGSFIAGALFGAQSAIPATYYLALVSSAPDPTLSGSSLAEPAASTGYARVAIANTTASFAIPVNGQVTNAAALSFPVATGDWGMLSWYVLCDASTAGNVILYASLDMPRHILATHTVAFQPGQLALSVTGVRRTVIGGNV